MLHINIATNQDWVHYWTFDGTNNTNTVYVLAKMPHEVGDGPDQSLEQVIDKCAEY